MKKFLLLLVLVLPWHLMAQVYYSPNQKMVEEAINKGLFVISQSYQLKDSVTNEYFGRGGLNEFGRIYSLGVKVKHGYCYLEQAERPWEYDEDFNRFRSSHVPVIYQTQFKEFTDSVMKEIPSFYQNQGIELLQRSIYLKIDSIPFKEDGFLLDTTIGKKKGWIVWLITNKPLQDATMQDSVSYLIYRKDLDVKEGIKMYETEEPTSSQKVQGGIFIESMQSAVGQLTFRLIGIVVAKEGKWNIVTPFINMKPLRIIAQSAESEVNGLTPVIQGKKEVGNDDKKDKKKNKKHKK